MKLWQYILMAALLATMPVLSACESSEEQNSQQKAYDDAIKAYQEQLKDYQERREAYQDEVNKAYVEYEKEMNIWYEQRQKQLKELAGQ